MNTLLSKAIVQAAHDSLARFILLKQDGNSTPLNKMDGTEVVEALMATEGTFELVLEHESRPDANRFTVRFSNGEFIATFGVGGQRLIQVIGEHETAMKADLYRTAARKLHHRDDECEIDENAKVSALDEGGAYVQAWVFVGDDKIG